MQHDAQIDYAAEQPHNGSSGPKSRGSTWINDSRGFRRDYWIFIKIFVTIQESDIPINYFKYLERRQ